MSGRISEQTIEEIKQRVDIVDLIGSRVKLSRAGANFKACCPFHDERTPSFMVSPARRAYHCFGCGESGDAFKFLMKTDGLTFVDAVKQLAKTVGVEIEETYDKEAGVRAALIKLHAELSAFYVRCLNDLPEAAAAREYLASRKLDADTVKRFGIGYAPDRAGAVEKWARENNFKLDDLVTAGVLCAPRAEYKNDGYWDRFRGRLMFPIRDQQGQVVGFSARILTNDKKLAKYVNSPETPVFKKGRLLYGLDFAKNVIVKDPRREAMICEGQIDVIRCHANGFANAIAGQGTAFTEEHVAIVRRYADSVLLVYDADTAGAKAAVRTGRLLMQGGLPVRIATLPVGEDPDSFLRDKGPDAFREAISSTESLVSYQIRTLRANEEDPDSIDAVGRISSEVIETLSCCDKAVIRSTLLSEAAGLLHVPESALESDLLEKAKQDGKANIYKQVSREATARQAAHQAAKPKADISEAVVCELAEVLLQSFDNPELAQFTAQWLPDRAIVGTATCHELLRTILADARDGTDNVSALTQQNDSAAGKLANELACRQSRFSNTGEISLGEAVQDLVVRIWCDYLDQQREILDVADPEQSRSRLDISMKLRRLKSARGWDARAQIISGL